MYSFGVRLEEAMSLRNMSQAELCKRSGLKSGHVSPYLNEKKDRDPRLSTAAAIADALDVSLDYLAGRTDNPMGFCDEELEGICLDSEAKELLRGFEKLPKEGREAIQDQVNYQLSKSEKEVPPDSVRGIA